MSHRNFGFWALQVSGWLLVVYFVYSQAIPGFSYELGVTMGTQESASEITEVGAAFWYGFAFADLVFYIPLLAWGLIGHLRNAPWDRVVLGAALGITVYWPIVCLAALVKARTAAGWNIASEMPYWVVCLAIAAWGGWGLCELLKRDRRSSRLPSRSPSPTRSGGAI